MSYTKTGVWVAEYVVQLILGHLKSPKRRQSVRCVMSVERVHKRVVVSMGGVLGLRYASTRTVGSYLFRSSHSISFTSRGREWGRVVI